MFEAGSLRMSGKSNAGFWPLSIALLYHSMAYVPLDDGAFLHSQLYWNNLQDIRLMQPNQIIDFYLASRQVIRMVP